MMHGTRAALTRKAIGTAALLFFACFLAGGSLDPESPAEGEGQAPGLAASPIVKCRDASGPAAGQDCEHVFMGVAAGFDFYCALSTTGKVYCWGDNSWGQLGVKKRGYRDRPVEVSGLGGRVEKIAAGYYHVCLLTADGAVECWGDNRYGQLGDGSRRGSYVPVAVSGLVSGVEQIVAGEGHTCAIIRDGSVRCWGKNSSGQLGDGDFKLSKVPAAVTGLPGPVRSLAAGAFHTCASTRDDKLWCWGDNERGQLGNMLHTDSPKPVAVKIPELPVLLAAAGRLHTCAVTGDHRLMCWGANDYGQVGNRNHDDTMKPGYVMYAQGREGNRKGRPMAGVAEVAASEDRTYIICADQSVKFCGYEQTVWGTQHGTISWWQAMTDFSPPVKGMIMLAAGGNMSYNSVCGLTVDGEVKCWGSGHTGRLGTGNSLDARVPTAPAWP